MLFSILYNLYSILQLAGTVLIVKVFGEKYFPQATNRIQEYIIWNGLKCYTIVEGKCRDCIKKTMYNLFRMVRLSSIITQNM